MKNRFKHLVFISLVALQSPAIHSQTAVFNQIRFSQVSTIHQKEGETKNQLLIDLETNTLFYRTNPRKIYRPQFIKNPADLSLLTNLPNYSRLKEIAISMDDSSHCTFHNEYGYYKIELLRVNGLNEVYSESFLINIPYNCLKEENDTLVRTYYHLVKNLIRESND